jgi:hypothetical protein
MKKSILLKCMLSILFAIVLFSSCAKKYGCYDFGIVPDHSQDTSVFVAIPLPQESDCTIEP